MVIPLKEVQKINRKASKPGNLIDSYVKVQDINNALLACKLEIAEDFVNEKVQKVIFDKLDTWLRC